MRSSLLNRDSALVLPDVVGRYNVVRLGNYEVPPQAGVAVYERGKDGLLIAAKIYDDFDFGGLA